MAKPVEAAISVLERLTEERGAREWVDFAVGIAAAAAVINNEGTRVNKLAKAVAIGMLASVASTQFREGVGYARQLRAEFQRRIPKNYL